MEARREATLAFNDDTYIVKFVKKGFEGAHQRYLLTIEGPGLKKMKLKRTVDLAALQRVLAAALTMPEFGGANDPMSCDWPVMRWLVAKVDAELKKNDKKKVRRQERETHGASSSWPLCLREVRRAVRGALSLQFSPLIRKEP